MIETQLFSQKLEKWLKSPGDKTYGDIEKLFNQKSFAVAFLLLMATAALPLPTGGITHLFEIMTMLLSLELIAGRYQLWSPRAWRTKKIGKSVRNSALPKLIKFINWFERHSRRRFASMFSNRLFLRFAGLFIFLFALASALAIPFSGLDTLPALGVVIIALSLILEDFVIFLSGFLTGVVGILLELSIGNIALHILR